jgi:hypothetical protein
MLNFLNTFCFVSGALILMMVTVAQSETATTPLTQPEQPEQPETIETVTTTDDLWQPLTVPTKLTENVPLTVINSQEQEVTVTTATITPTTDYSRYNVKQLKLMLTVRGVRGVSAYRKEQLLTTLTELDRQLT